MRSAKSSRSPLCFAVLAWTDELNPGTITSAPAMIAAEIMAHPIFNISSPQSRSLAGTLSFVAVTLGGSRPTHL